jgi:hypothetical protein
MNDQLPPIDPTVRDQLARRAAGHPPAGLLAEVSATLTEVDKPNARARWPRPIWLAPRLAGIGVGVALVAIVAIATILPAIHSGPTSASAGYPADRALTTAELAALLAGPPLAVNTTIVAAVTIDPRSDVCPMNRYPTVGVVEGLGSQVCVMDMAVEFSGADYAGTFAFRYLAPGYLGLLARITPTSTSRLAFNAIEDWPLTGKAFLVQGWLFQIAFVGNDPAVCNESSPVPAGDPLDPNGSDACVHSWIGATSAAAQPSFGDGLPGAPENARSVEAAGVAQIDSIPTGTPVHGVFVVRSVVEQCPGASPIDSVGCGAWRVLAKVADMSLLTLTASKPPATQTPSPSVAPPATPIASPMPSFVLDPTGLIGPGNRPLTASELSALIAADSDHLANRYVIDMRVTCQTGDCAGIPERPLADIIQPNGQIGLIGTLESRPDGSIVWTVPQAIPQYTASKDQGWQFGGAFYIVDAWISGHGESGCDAPAALCDDSWLGSGPNTRELTAQSGAFHKFGSTRTTDGPAIHGLFLVVSSPGGIGKTCSLEPVASAGGCSAHAEVLARLEPAVLP